MKPRVLVAGGAGFIGSHLVPALVRAGFSVRVLDSLSPQVHGAVPRGLEWLMTDGVEFHRGSVTSETDLRNALAGMDAVVHLAAETGTGQSMYEIARYYEVNVQATARLFDILANDKNRRVKRVVLASSRSIYGEGALTCGTCGDGKRVYPAARTGENLAANRWEHCCPSCGGELRALPTREDDPVRPASIYAATKYAQEDLVRIACISMGLGYAILRLQNVYGEGQSLNNPYTGILSIFSTRLRRGISLPIFEDGQETRDFVHVSDVARAFVAALALEQPVNSEINVGSGVGTPVLAVAQQLKEVFGASSDIQVTGQYRLGDIRHNHADISRLHALLHITPRMRLPDGLRRFADWVVEQPLPEDKLETANAEMKARGMMS